MYPRPGRNPFGFKADGELAKDRTLDMLHHAAARSDLRSPPGNRLEALRGRLRGLHSIRINDQWRLVFEWTSEGPARVKVTDYH